ncbi:MAG: VWA domain-containing protein [Verrucomicrobiaceae bacterium]|nr:VWA domain-containing protein [Verrucomicrobiaceae bacterium]
MRLLDPANLHLAWLALIPLALWLFRRQARRVPVSTLLFFAIPRTGAPGVRLAAPRQKVALPAAHPARPPARRPHPRAPRRRRAWRLPGAVVLVIDRSASMAAQDDTGRTRVDEARRLLAARVRSLPDQAVLSLIAFDGRPQVLLSRSRNRRECLRLLDEVRPLPVAGDPPAALAAARRLADLENGSRVWVATDTRPPGGQGVEFLDCALPEVTNAGITGFQIRPSPLSGGQQEVFVKISAAAANRARITSTLGHPRQPPRPDPGDRARSRCQQHPHPPRGGRARPAARPAPAHPGGCLPVG